MDLPQILGLISGVAWTIVYLVIIFRAFKDKASGMPLIALGLNISWEFIYSFIFPEINKIQLVINIVWFFFDIFIVVAKFLYGREEFESTMKGGGKKLFYSNLVLTLGICFFSVYFAAVEWKDYSGLYSAFIMNVLMSVMFIPMLTRRGNLNGQSFYVALFKLLGTLAPTIALSIGHPLILMLGATCFVYDSIYLVLICNAYKKAGLELLTRKPKELA